MMMQDRNTPHKRRTDRQAPAVLQDARDTPLQSKTTKRGHARRGTTCTTSPRARNARPPNCPGSSSHLAIAWSGIPSETRDAFTSSRAATYAASACMQSVTASRDDARAELHRTCRRQRQRTSRAAAQTPSSGATHSARRPFAASCSAVVLVMFFCSVPEAPARAFQAVVCGVCVCVCSCM